MGRMRMTDSSERTRRREEAKTRRPTGKPGLKAFFLCPFASSLLRVFAFSVPLEPLRRQLGRLLSLAAAVMLLLAVGIGTARAQVYTIEDLGALSGGSSRALGINSVGQVVGSASVGGAEHAFLWT